MSSAGKCPSCGAPIPPDAPKGLCPRCVYRLGFEKGPQVGPQAQPHPAESGPEPGTGPSLASRRHFGDYELLEEIGQGGMGVVYKARQKSLDRMVALKLLLFGSHAPPDSVKRFRAEAVATAALQHPHIVAIHEVGFCDGQHFIAMDYVVGQPLSALLRGGPLQARRAASYVKTIAEATHYAHERGILHRDLKPANILIDPDDQPRLTDFGLAKRLDDSGLAPLESELTVTGQVLGSPNYMPPEQATGRSGTVSRRTDVYALGAILYHTLSGRPPFIGESMADIVQQVLHVEPVSPRVLNPGVPADLETVCLKCLEKDPARRYATAQLLADELGRFLEDKPVVARPVGRIAKLLRWCRRNPRLAGAIGAFVSSLLIGLAGMAWQWGRAELQRARAEAERLLARQNAYAAEINLAQQALAENNLGRARELLEHHWPRADQPDLRSWEWRYLWQRCQGDELYTLAGHSNRVHSLAFSPDGRWLASAAADDTLRLWDLSARRQVALIDSPSDTYNAVLFSPDAQRLFTTATHESMVRIRRVPSFEPLGQLELGEEASRLALSPDGQILAAVGVRRVVLWRAADGRQVAVIALPGDPGPGRIAYSADGRWLGVDGASGDIGAGRVAFSADGRCLAVSASDGRILVWDWSSKSAIATLVGHTKVPPWGYPVFALGFAAENKTLVSAGSDSTVRVWDVAAGREQNQLEAQTSVVTDLAFSPDRKTMATVSTDQTLKLWEVATWRALGTLRGHLNEVWAVAFSPDGTTLATGGKDDSVKLWSRRLQPEPVVSRPLPTGTGFPRLAAHAGAVILLRTNGQFTSLHPKGWRETEPQAFPVPLREVADWAVAPHGTLLVVSDPKGPMKTWTLPECRPAPGFVGPSQGCRLLTFSDDGSRIAAASADRIFRVWEVASRRQIAQFTNQFGGTKGLALSPAGGYLAIGYEHGGVEVWEIASGKKLARFLAHKTGVGDLAFLSHPPQLVTASGDGTVKIWELRTQRLAATLRGSLLGMNSLTVSPDERRLAAGTGEGNIKLWDLDSYQEVATFRGHRSSPQVAFSLDGNDLIAASQGTVSVWHAPSFAEIEAAEKAAVQTSR